ncbi:MAG TPA: SDR family NAD(P)-dependent oxidoreductase [Terriglobales bacterium]|nr:SDR family NAD(P)-dependent oxidoreductase [Terriglobales bacterium]
MASAKEMDLTGRVVVITGASMGIGEALAAIFAARGASVVLSSRDAGRAETARQRVGHSDRTVALSCDVRNREEIDKVVSLTLHHFGRIDVWINNAGYGMRDSVEMMDMSECRAMFDTNLFGAIQGMQAVIPVMKQQGSGTIINISSVAGHIPLPYSAAYSATKFAMNAIGKAARAELHGTGVHVLTVCPGYVKTNFQTNVVRGRTGRELRRPTLGITAERVARATLRAYLKGKREIVVPWTNHIYVKFYQLFPGLVEDSMARMAKPARQAAETSGVKR